jgi:hypothetical protein
MAFRLHLHKETEKEKKRKRDAVSHKIQGYYKSLG